MSYLFKEALKIKSKFDLNISNLYNLEISNKAINIILEKQPLYEVEFFSQVLVDEMTKKEKVKSDFKYQIHYEPKHFVFDINQVPNWLKNRMSTLKSLISSLNNIINLALPIYINAPGQPSDLKGLYYVATTYANIFESIVTWTINTHNAHVPDECSELRDMLAKISSNAIKQTWDFPFEISKHINEAKQDIINNVERRDIQLMLKLNIDENDINTYNLTFENFKELFNKR